MIPMIQVMRKVAVTAIAAASLLPVLATAQYTFESKFGSSGTQPGQFSAPRGAAIDDNGQIAVVGRCSGEQFIECETFD